MLRDDTGAELAMILLISILKHILQCTSVDPRSKFCGFGSADYDVLYLGGGLLTRY